MRRRAIEGLKEGESFSYTRTFTEEENLDFGRLTRDYNPVHYDLRWAEATGFRGLICHGLIVGSMICEFGGQAGMLATKMDFRFMRPVYFGDTITCTITLTKLQEGGKAEAEAVFTNGTGEQVCRAFLSGRLPRELERELLNQMVEEGDPDNRLK
ncbi:MAG: MaoC family dehydratase [Deltaproteobacteria bacterium]|nr:MaoC family dehydratase [Deltaproteobacteria bacterium]